MKKYVAALGLLLALSSPVLGQSSPSKYFSAASTNSTLVQAAVSSNKFVTLKTGIALNTTMTVYYLKLYDKATAPTCGTDTPVWTLPIPFATSNAVGGFVLPLADGLQFKLGLGFCITGAIADNDTSNAATGVVVNLGVSAR
jgi:hypothetical protein